MSAPFPPGSTNKRDGNTALGNDYLMFSPIPASAPRLRYLQSTPRDHNRRSYGRHYSNAISLRNPKSYESRSRDSSFLLDDKINDSNYEGGLVSGGDFIASSDDRDSMIGYNEGMQTSFAATGAFSRMQILQAGSHHEMHVNSLPIEIKEEFSLLGAGQETALTSIRSARVSARQVAMLHDPVSENITMIACSSDGKICLWPDAWRRPGERRDNPDSLALFTKWISPSEGDEVLYLFPLEKGGTFGFGAVAVTLHGRLLLLSLSSDSVSIAVSEISSSASSAAEAAAGSSGIFSGAISYLGSIFGSTTASREEVLSVASSGPEIFVLFKGMPTVIRWILDDSVAHYRGGMPFHEVCSLSKRIQKNDPDINESIFLDIAVADNLIYVLELCKASQSGSGAYPSAIFRIHRFENASSMSEAVPERDIFAFEIPIDESQNFDFETARQARLIIPNDCEGGYLWYEGEGMGSFFFSFDFHAPEPHIARLEWLGFANLRVPVFLWGADVNEDLVFEDKLSAEFLSTYQGGTSLNILRGEDHDGIVPPLTAKREQTISENTASTYSNRELLARAITHSSPPPEMLDAQALDILMADLAKDYVNSWPLDDKRWADGRSSAASRILKQQLGEKKTRIKELFAYVNQYKNKFPARCICFSTIIEFLDKIEIADAIDIALKDWKSKRDKGNDSSVTSQSRRIVDSMEKAICQAGAKYAANSGSGSEKYDAFECFFSGISEVDAFFCEMVAIQEAMLMEENSNESLILVLDITVILKDVLMHSLETRVYPLDPLFDWMGRGGEGPTHETLKRLYSSTLKAVESVLARPDLMFGNIIDLYTSLGHVIQIILATSIAPNDGTLMTDKAKKSQKELCRTLLEPLIDHDDKEVVELAHKFGQHYRHYEILIELCENPRSGTNRDTDRLARYKEMFGEEFEEQLMGWYLSKKKHSLLLTQQGHLSSFLEVRNLASLSWLHNTKIDRYDQAGLDLISVAHDETSSADKKKTILSLAKISLHAAKQNSLEVEYEILLLEDYQDYVNSLLEKAGKGINTKPLSPIELSAALADSTLYCSENEDSRHGFLKALELLDPKGPFINMRFVRNSVLRSPEKQEIEDAIDNVWINAISVTKDKDWGKIRPRILSEGGLQHLEETLFYKIFSDLHREGLGNEIYPNVGRLTMRLKKQNRTKIAELLDDI
eukprot:UC4_evm10s74